MVSGKKGRNGTKKYGRMKKKCEEYKKNHTREKNKIRKIMKHLRHHPNDVHSFEQLERLEKFIEGNRV